jgi:chaperonin GroEL
VETGDAIANVGARLMLDMARNQRRGGGTGAKMAIILTQELFRSALDLIQTDHVSIGELKSEINAAVVVAHRTLDACAKQVTVDELLQNSSADSELVRTALKIAGTGGVVDIELSTGKQESVGAVDGDTLDEGYLSPHFATDAEYNEAVLEDPYILLCDKTLAAFQPLLPILEAIAKESASLLVIARDVKDEALAALVVNRLKGTLKVAAIHAPGFGDARLAKLQDLARLTGGAVITDSSAVQFDNLQLNGLGRAHRVVVSAEQTTIVVEDLANRSIRNVAPKRNDGGRRPIAVISVAGHREVEMKQRQKKLRRQISFVTNAAQYGVVAGGGATYIRCADKVSPVAVRSNSNPGEQLLARALEEPARQLLRNMGFDEEKILNELRKRDASSVFNVESAQFEDMLSATIVDSKQSLHNAIDNTVALTFRLLTGSIIELQEKSKQEEINTAAGSKDDQ